MPSDDTLRVYKHVLPSQFGALSKTVLVQVIGKKVPSLPRDKTLLGVLTCGVKAKYHSAPLSEQVSASESGSSESSRCLEHLKFAIFLLCRISTEESKCRVERSAIRAPLLDTSKAVLLVSRRKISKICATCAFPGTFFAEFAGGLFDPSEARKRDRGET